MLGTIGLALLLGLALLVAGLALLVVPAALLSRLIRRIQAPSPVVARAVPRETGAGSRLVTRSSI